MGASLSQIKRIIASYQERWPLYREVLQLYENVVTQQWQFRPDLQIKTMETSEDLLKQRWENGLPLLGKEAFCIDVEGGKNIFFALCNVCADATPKMAKEVPKIATLVKDKGVEVDGLLAQHHDKEYLHNVALQCGVDTAVLNFLVEASVKPSIELHVARVMEGLSLEWWMRGNCPLCGSPPLIAKLHGEEGKRYLQCSFCTCQWRTVRIACPYCDNKEFATLSYLSSEDEDGYRADLCEKCKGYIKTLDARKLDYEPHLELEDIITTHWDLVAMQRGYRRPVSTPWSPIVDDTPGGLYA